MEHPYALASVARSPLGRITADLTESGLVVARVRRPSVRGGYVAPFEAKWFSERAKARFEDFADSLSIEEAIEALLPL